MNMTPVGKASTGAYVSEDNRDFNTETEVC